MCQYSNEPQAIIPGFSPSYGPSASDNTFDIDCFSLDNCILFRSTLRLPAAIVSKNNCRQKNTGARASPYAGTIYIFSIRRMHYGHGSGMARNISSNPLAYILHVLTDPRQLLFSCLKYRIVQDVRNRLLFVSGTSADGRRSVIAVGKGHR